MNKAFQHFSLLANHCIVPPMSNRFFILLSLCALIGVGLAVYAFIPPAETLDRNDPRSWYALPQPTEPSRAKSQMVAAANPYATRAGQQILDQGGSAVDAAIAVSLVLSLVEPQASGIGGGGFMMVYDKPSGHIRAYDGRETAPRNVTENLFLTDDGEPMGFFDAVIGGSSVGVPGLVAMMALAHEAHGRLPWKDLFEPAITLAEQGFLISPRLHKMVQRDPVLRQMPRAQAYLFKSDGTAKRQGEMLVNLDFGQTLRTVAEEGPRGFYRGAVALDLVRTVTEATRNPSAMTLADMATYQAKERVPVCGAYRSYRLCGMPPPSSGGTTVLAILGLLERFDMASHKLNTDGVHLFAEASKLAYADRDLYVGDPDFVDVPIAGLIDPAYLEKRSALIGRDKTLPAIAPAGTPPLTIGQAAPDHGNELPSTSHLSIVDQWGQVVSMTNSIEGPFGSHLMSGGFFLNNELTDFSFAPRAGNLLIQNRVQPGKRPRSSMAPFLVFDENGTFVAAIGSPGGNSIISYVAQALVGLLDWDMSVLEAVSMPHVMNRNRGETILEQDSAITVLGEDLAERGHTVVLKPMTSGLHAIVSVPGGYDGAADPRREGRAEGK